ncbi:hypothetical protein BD626DRAFT_496435 [Schizophyllum amplum]|uniref:Protein-S-isoprenylcysteine O-methyltransferase n=1 Tax=Schizophyllum amplum TaxID=97359 RepID=A0A550CD94_9AGAR|nr:hypothetical protein BD626DRAFT_496435 [Auriculariopsis ampla]
MSLARALLSTILVLCDQVAFGFTRTHGIYHAPCNISPSEPRTLAGHLRRTQRTALLLLALFEWLAVIDVLHTAYHGHASPFTSLCQTTSSAWPALAATQATTLGVVLATLGALLRLDAGAAPAGLSLPAVPRTSPMRSRWHAYVRHPEEAGALLSVAGAVLLHLTSKGWLATCSPSLLMGPLGRSTAAVLYWGCWLLATAAEMRGKEDGMRVTLRKQWASYTSIVRWKVIPGVY